MSFLSSAGRKVTDIRSFLRETANSNSIRYYVEKGAKHFIYVPYVTNTVVDEEGNERVEKQIIAISGDIHEWNSLDNRYNAVVCLKGVVRKSDDGIIINDGSCPFCDRISDAWEIYKYRRDLEEKNCRLTGEQRERRLEKIKSTLADQRKAKEARSYMYILIAQFRTEDGKIVFGEDKLPLFDLKVMKLSRSRVEKIQQQVENAGSELPGSELTFEYSSKDDRRLQVAQSTVALVFPNNMLTKKYPELLKKINEAVSKFEWEGIEKAFKEWEGMSTAEAKRVTDELFEQWDRYQKELKVNPNAKYMEYVVESDDDRPKLESNTSVNKDKKSNNIPDVNYLFGGDDGEIKLNIE